MKVNVRTSARGQRLKFVVFAVAVLAVLASACSRKRGPTLPKQSLVWPKYHRVVMVALKGRVHKAFGMKGAAARREAIRALARRVGQVMKCPALTRAEEERVVQVLLMAKTAEVLLSNWRQINREEHGTTGLPHRCAHYVKEFREIEEWIEQQAPAPTDAAIPLAEAIVAETDKYMAYRLRWLKRFAETESMGGAWDYSLAPWQQPGSGGQMLREMVLLYALMARPDSQLDTYLGFLGRKFGVQLDRVDAGCALARAGKVEMATRVLRKVLGARPRNSQALAVRQRIALCFHESANQDTAAAVAVLDGMMDQSRGRMQVAAILKAAECYERMDELTRAVVHYRRAYEEGRHTPVGFSAGLKAAELEAFELDSPESAAEAVERALANAPTGLWADAHLLLLRVYGKLKRFDDMAEMCKKLAIDDSETEPGATTLLAAGNLLFNAGANDQALKMLNEYLPLFQEHDKEAQARLLVALVLLNKWENAKARAQVKAILALNPEEDIAARAQFLMGYSYVVVQEYEKAKWELDSLCRLYPETKWAKTAEKRYLSKLRRPAGKDAGSGDRSIKVRYRKPVPAVERSRPN